MFEIFMMVGWTLLGILLLYLWADVREVKREMKNYRRDLMRNSLGGRTSDNYPGFSEEDYWKEAREAQEKDAKKARKSAPLATLEESGEADTYLEQIARGQGNQPQEIRQQEAAEAARRRARAEAARLAEEMDRQADEDDRQEESQQEENGEAENDEHSDKQSGQHLSENTGSEKGEDSQQQENEE